MSGTAIETYARALLHQWQHGGRVACLADPDADAGELLCALKSKFGGAEFWAWEPETIWLSAPELHELNRDKVLAGIAIMTQPVFFVDPLVFGHTACVLGGDVTVTAAFPRPDAAQMSWAVIEGRLIFALEGEDDAAFSEDVWAFVAAKLAADGWVTAPKYLAHAQEALDSLLSDGGKDLAAKMKAHDGGTSKDDALEVQRHRADEVELYVEHRLGRLTSSSPS